MDQHSDKYQGKYKGKYRIKSHRRPGWNYASDGYYFVTFVTKNRACLFGSVIDRALVLSEFGKIIDTEWLKSFDIRKELYLDEYVIMPNHIHGLVIIRNDEKPRYKLPSVETVIRKDGVEMPRCQPQSISSFISGYKSGAITAIDNYIDDQQLPIPKYNRSNPLWQNDFYDRVIRFGVGNEDEYWRIKMYIRNNPKKWIEDKLYGDK